ncbi:hypothetical protein [Streptomyces sp. SID14515]|uniref:hypothetical protein n=1 Tax=Streptomyces sp. SID14515 TaxID=2706074 RepID=UPI0013CB27FF|nr:hypothetical protein [Streptomyces sp. SID14515]NEB35372.1 hypothetical protein [Streptomyces sp. SID14515]
MSSAAGPALAVPTVQRARQVGEFSHRHEGGEDRANRTVLDLMTALRMHTEQLYERIRTSMSKLAALEGQGGEAANRKIDLTQYNLWSGPEKWADHPTLGSRYGAKERTGEYLAHQAPGFTMDQTPEHFKALGQLQEAGYASPHNLPKDPEYQKDFIRWLKENEEKGVAFDAKREQDKFLELKAKGAGRERARTEPSGDGELVGWHSAQFASAWEPTSDLVAENAALAMIPVRSHGLDDPLADGGGTTHPAPAGTVQVRQEIPMIIRVVGQVADDLNANVRRRQEIARLAADEETGRELALLAARAEEGVAEFRAGAQRLDINLEREERARSAELMRTGRQAYLSAAGRFDALLGEAGCPAAEPWRD